MKQNSIPLGTPDIFGSEFENRDFVVQCLKGVYLAFGYDPLQTPAIEFAEVFTGHHGEGEKFLFHIKDAQGKDLVLRYDMTVPFARFAAEHPELPRPIKRYQMQMAYRDDAVDKGRLREFYQCDIDIIGENSIVAEMELIAATTSALQAIGFTDFSVRINDRRILTDMILAAGFNKEDIDSVCISFDKLDKIGLDGVKDELNEKEYAPELVAKFIAILSDTDSDALSIAEKYCTNSAVISDLKQVLVFANQIANGKFVAVYDKSLVRGMGYYTGMVFEIVSPKFGSSVAGGGRYDDMIGKFLGESVPAVGFSIGFERISAILLSEGFMPPAKEKAVLAYTDETPFADVVMKAKIWQEKGYEITMLKRSKKFGKQLDMLVKEGVKLLINAEDGITKIIVEKK